MNENNTQFFKNNNDYETGNHIYQTDPIFLISLVVNILLLLTTGLSEIMASSHCRYNSIWQLIISPLYNKLKNKEEEDIDEETGEITGEV